MDKTELHDNAPSMQIAKTNAIMIACMHIKADAVPNQAVKCLQLDRAAAVCELTSDCCLS